MCYTYICVHFLHNNIPPNWLIYISKTNPYWQACQNNLLHPKCPTIHHHHLYRSYTGRRFWPSPNAFQIFSDTTKCIGKCTQFEQTDNSRQPTLTHRRTTMMMWCRCLDTNSHTHTAKHIIGIYKLVDVYTDRSSAFVVRLELGLCVYTLDRANLGRPEVHSKLSATWTEQTAHHAQPHYAPPSTRMRPALPKWIPI